VSQPAAEVPRFEIARAFQAHGTLGLAKRLDEHARWATRLSQTMATTQAAWLTASMPRLNLISPMLPATQIDWGFQQAISKNLVSQRLGLLGLSQQFAYQASSLLRLNLISPILPAARIDWGFQQAISRKVISWDLGLLGIKQQFARSTALAALPHDLFHNISSLTSIAAFVRQVNFTAMSAVASLTDLFRRWREAAEFGLGFLRRLARAAYKAALNARAAVLNGDEGPVAWFIENWLNLRVTPERIEAVSAALLEEGWDASVPENPAHLLTDLQSRTARQARVLKPIWETRLNHRTVGSLDHLVVTGNGTLLAIADLVPAPCAVEDLALASECEEHRLHRVLARLKPDELKITNVYAQRSELTWAEAARIAGASDPAAMGERIRRKLKRLGTEDKRRLMLRPAGA
jgi:hypothetical protein